jgi:phosphoribosylaminoimidazole-succinocarboxamide synthase
MTQALESLSTSDLHSLKLLHRGKVRDLYAVDDERLLILTTDRISAFDVVLPTPIPGKGRVLTELSNFWFHKTRDLIPNHLLDVSLADTLAHDADLAQAQGRAVVVRRLKPLPVEAIVRGYLVGSGWKDYQKTGAVCGIPLPAGLTLAERLPQAIFTPSTKGRPGEHDENISFEQAVESLGERLAEQVRAVSIALYQEAADYAAKRGIIIADTKFEFGLDENKVLVLIDEALTPDSSRFWPADGYAIGSHPPSFDKQYVRDYLESIGWDKRPPGPELPDEVVARTREKYHEALRRLTGNAD